MCPLPIHFFYHQSDKPHKHHRSFSIFLISVRKKYSQTIRKVRSKIGETIIRPIDSQSTFYESFIKLKVSTFALFLVTTNLATPHL